MESNMKKVFQYMTTLLLLLVVGTSCEEGNDNWRIITDAQPGAYITGDATIYSATATSSQLVAAPLDGAPEGTNVIGIYTWLKIEIILMNKPQITIKDIARALNVSPSTVSRALKDNPDISRETRDLIHAYAREHNYKPNVLAVNLRSSRSNTIGVIVPQLVHHFFSCVLSGIETAAAKAGYNIIVAQSNESYE